MSSQNKRSGRSESPEESGSKKQKTGHEAANTAAPVVEAPALTPVREHEMVAAVPATGIATSEQSDSAKSKANGTVAKDPSSTKQGPRKRKGPMPGKIWRESGKLTVEDHPILSRIIMSEAKLIELAQSSRSEILQQEPFKEFPSGTAFYNMLLVELMALALTKPRLITGMCPTGTAYSMTQGTKPGNLILKREQVLNALQIDEAMDGVEPSPKPTESKIYTKANSRAVSKATSDVASGNADEDAPPSSVTHEAAVESKGGKGHAKKDVQGRGLPGNKRSYNFTLEEHPIFSKLIMSQAELVDLARSSRNEILEKDSLRTFPSGTKFHLVGVPELQALINTRSRLVRCLSPKGKVQSTTFTTRSGKHQRTLKREELLNVLQIDEAMDGIEPYVDENIPITQGRRSILAAEKHPILSKGFMTDAELRKLAQEHREEITRQDPSSRFPSGTKFHYMNRQELSDLAITRPRLTSGIWSGGSIWSKATRDIKGEQIYLRREQILHALQIDEAMDGIEPYVDPGLASPWHGWSSISLYDYARQKGYRGKLAKDGETINKDAILQYLMLNEEFPKTELSAEQYAFITDMVTQIVVPQQAGQATTGTSNSYVSTYNQGLYGLPDAVESLESITTNAYEPEDISDVGHLCAIRALAAALQAAREDYCRSMRYGFPQRLSADDIMGLLFSDYNSVTANDPAIVPDDDRLGTPTPAYASFIQARLEDFFGPGSENTDQYQAERRVFLAMANMGISQLQTIIAFLVELDILEAEYAIGVVTGAREVQTGEGVTTTPAIATLHTVENVDAPVLWLYNSNTEGASAGELSHWEAFTPYGGSSNSRNLGRVIRWGLKTFYTTNVQSTTFSSLSAHITETPEQEVRRRARNEQHLRSFRERLLRKGCLRCQRLKLTDCDGAPTFPTNECSSCKNEKVVCKFPGHRLQKGQWKQANELIDQDILPWEGPNIDKEGLDHFRALAIPDPEPVKKHILIIASGRMSSNNGPRELGQLIQNLPFSARTYETYLRGPMMLGQNQEGYLAAPEIRVAVMAFCRQGTRPLPWALGNNMDPFLRSFVSLFFDAQTGIMRTPHVQNPHVIPEEIHFLLNGIAGSCVDILGFGNYTRGFFKKVLDLDARHNTDVANRIFIVPHIQPHVVDGVADHSLDFPNASTPPWVGYRNQYFQKRKLKSLIDRMNFLEVNTNLANAGLPALPRPGHLDPHWDDDQRNDAFLAASYAEYAWRAGGLDGTTVPTETQVQTRNNNRNTYWM